MPKVQKLPNLVTLYLTHIPDLGVLPQFPGLLLRVRIHQHRFPHPLHLPLHDVTGIPEPSRPDRDGQLDLHLDHDRAAHHLVQHKTGNGHERKRKKVWRIFHANVAVRFSKEHFIITHILTCQIFSFNQMIRNYISPPRTILHDSQD